jgi:pimeloyl-ACP methyl ester carboxylesterase
MITESVYDMGLVQLNYAEGGAMDKPALVFLHGLTGRWQAYTEEFETYGKDWHIYALDLRGHGKSSKPDQGYAIPDYARDVISFLNGEVGEAVVLVGHSTGALVTLAVAASAPDTVRAIIANDPPLLGADVGIDDFPGPKMWFTFVYETVKGKPTIEQVLAACKLAQPEAEGEQLQEIAQQVSGVAPGAVLNALEDRHLEGLDLQKNLGKIKCPTLMLYGDLEFGSVVREQDAQEFQRLIPQAVVRKIEGGSHMLWWEQAVVTRKHVEAFCAALDEM